ncbi:MAG: ABC transporter permease [Anaerolineales bacterium]|nr:ABC transporter permease [Anaerolineales bacterium]
MNQLTSINNELSNSLTESSTMSMGVWKRFRRHPGAIFGMIVLSILLVMALAAPLSPYDPEASEMTARYEAPSASHIMGTDALGRDLFTRILYGGRVSLTVGVLVVVLSIFIGVPVGALAGYYGGTVDSVLMRITDAFLSLPSFLVLILLSAILLEVKIPYLEGNSVLTISFVIGVFSWTTFARLVRAAFLGIRETEFVAASRALGGSDMRIMTRHILPNAIGPIIVEATLEFGYAIIEESGLSFLGFGIQPPTPSWGNLLSNAQDYFVKYPWLAIFPGLMIFLSIISINYIGDGLRDAFDPNKVLSKVGEV